MRKAYLRVSGKSRTFKEEGVSTRVIHIEMNPDTGEINMTKENLTILEQVRLLAIALVHSLNASELKGLK